MIKYKSNLFFLLCAITLFSCEQRVFDVGDIAVSTSNVILITALHESALFGKWKKKDLPYPVLQFGQEKYKGHTDRYFESISDSEPFSNFKGEFEITDDSIPEKESPYGPNMLILKQDSTDSKSKNELRWMCARLEYKDENNILLSEFQIDKGKCPNISSDSKKILWERFPPKTIFPRIILQQARMK